MMGMQFPCGQNWSAGCPEQPHFPVRPSFKTEIPQVSGLENKAAQMLRAGETPADVAHYTLDYILAVVDQITRNAREKFGDLPLIYAGGVMSNRYIAGEIRRRYGGFFAEPAFSSDKQPESLCSPL